MACQTERKTLVGVDVRVHGPKKKSKIGEPLFLGWG